ncbi:hypothetical protein Tco_0715378 [Tanacetum coccineum]
MPTKMELTLEQTQQGVSYEVSMEILLEPTSNKLMVEFDESNANVLERFYTSARKSYQEILLKLNIPDHRRSSWIRRLLTKHWRMTEVHIRTHRFIGLPVLMQDTLKNGGEGKVKVPDSS